MSTCTSFVKMWTVSNCEFNANWLFWVYTTCFFSLETIGVKMFKFSNRFWKSVSSKTAVAPSSRFRESETLFQNRSRAKHWFKNLTILVSKRLTVQIQSEALFYFFFQKMVSFRRFCDFQRSPAKAKFWKMKIYD